MRRDQRGGAKGGEDVASRSFAVNGVLASPGELSLKFGGEEVLLEPKVMAVLEALAERPGRAWTREELIDRIWRDGGGGDESLTRAIYVLRKALDQCGAGKAALVTVPRRGYRLNAEIDRAPPAAGAAGAAFAPLPFSIAVLPFADQSEDQANGRLADGLTRDFTALLSRTPRFRVAPISSAAHYASSSAESPALARKLNVRFLTRGSLVRHGEEIRVRVELIDGVEDVLLWAHRYDTQLDRFFQVQDDAVCAMTTAISAKVKVPRPEPGRYSKAFYLSSYERVQSAEALRYNYSRNAAREVVSLLDSALLHAPNDPAVGAALAVQLSQNVVSRWEDDPAATMKKADRLIADALSLSPDDPDVLTAAGIVATMFHRPDEAIAYLERSIALNPNDAHALAVLGWQRCLRHDDPEGIRLINIAEERAPHHPRFALWATYRATAHLFMQDYGAGLDAAKQAVARTPSYYQPLLHCAWAHVSLGDPAAAGDAIRQAEAIQPGVLPEYVDEMRKWSANSPNKTSNHEVLARLLALGAEAVNHCAHESVDDLHHGVSIDVRADR